MTTVVPEPDQLLRRLLSGRDATCLTHVESVPARTGMPARWPDWMPESLRDAFGRRGITCPWRHQVAAAELAFARGHVVVATGTASGKSLAYQMPALATLLADPRTTVLYLAPTKALAADQLRTVSELDLPDIRAACFDGDTPREERDWIRKYSRFVLTNPDMLHYGILPRHDTWSTFLRRLTYVVIDECHAYRGVFGSHVAHVLRRLRRVATKHGGEPVFVLASATTGDPASTAARLIGTPVTAIMEDGSPRGGMSFALWEPPLLRGTAPAGRDQDIPSGDTGDDTAARRHTVGQLTELVQRTTAPPDVADQQADAAPVRKSALRETADLLTEAVAAGIRTLAFVRSRRGAEAVASMAQHALGEIDPDLRSRVAAYRSGYLREERRTIERALLDGSLLGLATTNALELGIDLAGLDAVILAGYPGRLASMWQQAGRAGRAGRDALCVLVARDDPLDTFLVHHPEALFRRPVEACVLDPDNPYVLGPQLAAAACELPLTGQDLELFGGRSAAVVTDLVKAGVLRRRPNGWYWVARDRPDVDLRGTGGSPVAVIETTTGRLLGTVDHGSAHFLVHPGAVYIHQGVSYVVDDLDLDDAAALAHPDNPQWTTHPRDVTTLSVRSVRSYVDAGPIGLFLGEVDVTARVTSYQRRRLTTGEVIDTRPLDLPERCLQTTAVWWTASPLSLEEAGVDSSHLPGALHAAEHAAIGLLPLVATCDRWDIGGLSTAAHPDTEAPTVFVYDGHAGGAGFAERAYSLAKHWLDATRMVIADCGCDAGCPSCIQSPKCGNGNSPLDKAGAIAVLDLVLRSLRD